MRIRGRARLIVVLAGVALLLAAAGSLLAWTAVANRGEVADLLPNVTAAAPDGLSGRTGGTLGAPRFFLGFKSAAANLGNGPLVVLGARRDTLQPRMRLKQQIVRSDGTTRVVPIRSALRYTRAATHAHWHLQGFMRYELRSADGGRTLKDRKTGFCLGDRYRAALELPGRAPSARFDDACGRGATKLLTIREGISVGWGDDYAAHLEGQEFEVTRLPAGRYVLVHRVNPTRDLLETDYSDNTASMAIDLSWPRGRGLPPRIDVVARCTRTARCP